MSRQRSFATGEKQGMAKSPHEASRVHLSIWSSGQIRFQVSVVRVFHQGSAARTQNTLLLDADCRSSGYRSCNRALPAPVANLVAAWCH